MRRKFVAANEEYKQNLSKKTNESNSSVSTKSVTNTYKNIRNKQNHFRALRRSGLGSGGIGRF